MTVLPTVEERTGCWYMVRLLPKGADPESGWVLLANHNSENRVPRLYRGHDAAADEAQEAAEMEAYDAAEVALVDLSTVRKRVVDLARELASGVAHVGAALQHCIDHYNADITQLVETLNDYEPVEREFVLLAALSSGGYNQTLSRYSYDDDPTQTAAHITNVAARSRSVERADDEQ